VFVRDEPPAVFLPQPNRHLPYRLRAPPSPNSRSVFGYATHRFPSLGALPSGSVEIDCGPSGEHWNPLSDEPLQSGGCVPGRWRAVRPNDPPPCDFNAPAGKHLANAAGRPCAEDLRDVAVGNDGATRHLVDQCQHPFRERGGASRGSFLAQGAISSVYGGDITFERGTPGPDRRSRLGRGPVTTSVLRSLLSSRACRSLPLRRRSTPSARRRSATWRLRRGSPCR
jgi:hypothetical protein